MTAAFTSREEFREVLDRMFSLMSEDPDVGPQLRAADASQRWEFPDLGLVVNLRPGGAAEPNLTWEWSDEIAWEPTVRMRMSSEIANRYFQGLENVALAIARRRIKATGDLAAARALVGLYKPVFPVYRDMIAADYPHLTA